jgi:hypothetical protein
MGCHFDDMSMLYCIYIYTHVYTYMHIHYINIIQLYIIILHMRIILSI